MDLNLRNEIPGDYREVEELTREAFWNVNVPGCDEHYLAHVLRTDEAFIPSLDFVAICDGKIVGNIMYTHTRVIDDVGNSHAVITFGPVSVLPAYQNRGIGSKLIRHTIALSTELGFRAILTYGDPDYYVRFGFEPAEKYGIRTSDGYFLSALIAHELYPGALSGISGRFLEGSIFELDADLVCEFDKGFAPKEKFETDSQRRFIEILATKHL